MVRVGTEDSGGELLEIDAYVRSGGAVTGEHTLQTGGLQKALLKESTTSARDGYWDTLLRLRKA